MGLFQKINDALRGSNKVKQAYQETTGQVFVNAMCSAYENVFAQVRPLIDEMETIIPYGVGQSGKPLAITRTPELAALMEPNKNMGYIDFIDSLLACWLTLSEVNVHVWKGRNGKVVGYSILPPGCRTGMYDNSGRAIFQVFTGQEGAINLTSDEVITLRFSRNPLNLDKGVSPASSVFVYSQIDDLMAQLQKALLENGGVPAYITTIRASTYDKFLEKQRKLEASTKGARNANKSIYLWRAFDNDTGEEKDEVEIKPIQAKNTELAIKELMSVVDSRLNKAFGVSEFILGNDSSAKYDNAELSDLQFTKRRVYPALRRFWGQFQHELDRITGGIGYAITFDLEIPELTDRLKTKAETAKINSENLASLIQSGATPSAAVEALGLPEEWQSVANGIYHRVLSDKAEGYSQSPARENKNQAVTNPLISVEGDSTSNDKLAKCNTSQLLNSNDLTERTTTDAYTPVFGDDEQDAKRIYDQLMKIARQIAAQNPEIPVEEVEKVILDVLTGDADDGANAGAKRLRGLAYGNSITEEDAEALRGEINETLEADGFHVSEEFVQNLSDRVNSLVEKYVQDTEGIIAKTLNTAQEEGLSQQQITSRLSEVLPRARAEMIARNETVNAFRIGRLANDEYLAQKYNLKLKKVWRCHHDGATCPLCEAMDGEIVGLREAFPSEVTTKDGEVLAYRHDHWNMNGESPNAHVNCRCYFNEEVDDD